MVIPFDEEIAAFGQLVDLIRQFPMGSAFLLWIAKGDLESRIVFEKTSSEEIERVIEFYIDGLKIASGGGQYYLTQAEEGFTRDIINEQYEQTALMSEFLKIEKRIVTDLLIDSTYTIVYQFVSSGKVCGSCWGIYDMQNLLHVCRARNIHLSCPDLKMFSSL